VISVENRKIFPPPVRPIFCAQLKGFPWNCVSMLGVKN